MSTMVRRLRSHGLAKLCAAWVALGLTLVVTLGALGAPEWMVPLTAGALMLALPFVMVLAWALQNQRFEGRNPRRD